MSSKIITDLYVDPTALAIVAGMRSQDLDDLEEAIHARRLQLMADRLEANGFRAMVQHQDTFFNMLLVGVPNVTAPALWATLEECRRLLDTARNLPPAEAFSRWREKVQTVNTEPYTEADAKADVRRERAELHRRYAAGEIDGQQFAELYKDTRSYLDLVER